MKRKLAASLTVAASVALLAGCSSGSDDAGTPADQASASGDWTLVQGKGPDGDFTAVTDAPITLTLDESGAAFGSAGCNNYTTEMKIGSNGEVTVSDFPLTMMLCEDDVMAAEQAFTQSLTGVTRVTIEGDALLLSGENVELSFARQQ